MDTFGFLMFTNTSKIVSFTLFGYIIRCHQKNAQRCIRNRYKLTKTSIIDDVISSHKNSLQ